MPVYRIALLAAFTVAILSVFGQAAEKPVDFSHGQLQVSENHRFLVHEDGTPFFYLGDTAWQLLHDLDRGEVELYLENRRQKGFTVVQTVVLAEYGGLDQPNAYGHYALKDKNDPTTPDVKEGPDNDYWDHVEWVVDRACEKGLYIGLLPTWGRYVTSHWKFGIVDGIFTPRNAEAYGRFIGERFHDKPNIIWIIGGDRAAPTDEAQAIWRALAKGIALGVLGTEDYRKIMMTYHTSGPGLSSEFFHNDAWCDFNAIQSSHGDSILNYKMIESDYGLFPPKPTIDLETTYPELVIQANQRPANDDDARRAAYWAVFAGAFGHTYGHNAIWQMHSPSKRAIAGVKSYWKDALDVPSAAQMGYLRRLIESRPFLSRVPDPQMIHSGQGEGIDYAIANRGGGYAMVYFPTGKPITLHLGKISGETIQAWWFDPRTGGAQTIGEFANQGTRRFDPPGGRTIRGNDWVLVLDDVSRRFPEPGQ